MNIDPETKQEFQSSQEMTSPQTINSPEESLDEQEGVVFSTSPGPEEDATLKLHRLIGSLALDREAHKESQRQSQLRYELMMQENSEMNRKLAESHSKLQEVVILLSQQMAKQLDEKNKADTAARHVQLPMVVQSPLFDTKSEGKINSPIIRDTEEHELNFLADSALYGFNRPEPRRPTVPVEKRDYGQQKTRRESQVISDMKYNITRANESNVYKMVTNDPFTKKLVKLEMSSFITWYSQWNDHMVLSKTFTEPTNLVSSSIREILCENNGLSLRDFHALEPDDFIYMVSKELKIHSRKEFHEQMMESYGAMPKIYFRPSNGVKAHAEFYTALLARRNYFRKCLELLSIHSAAFCPRLKGDKGLVRIFTSTLELSYVKEVQDEMGTPEEYDGMTSYLSAFCDVAQVHLELAKSYSRVPLAFGNNKKPDSSNETAVVPYVRFDKKGAGKDPDYNRGSYKPKEAWKDRNKGSYPPRRSELANMDGHPKEEESDCECSEEGEGSQCRDCSSDPDPPVDEIFEAMLAEACLTTDRTDRTRELFMASEDGENRPRGCIYFTIFGSCLKANNCVNAEGHNAQGRVRCSQWLIQKLNEKPSSTTGTSTPQRILSRPHTGAK
jgi:hypothetical protein